MSCEETMSSGKKDEPTSMGEWLSLIGPVYVRSGLGDLLGLNEAQIDLAEAAGEIIAVHSTDGDVGYPAFQFSAVGGLLPRLPEAVAILRHHALDEWTIAMILYRPREEWEGDAAFELLTTAMADEVLLLGFDQPAATPLRTLRSLCRWWPATCGKSCRSYTP